MVIWGLHITLQALMLQQCSLWDCQLTPSTPMTNWTPHMRPCSHHGPQQR